jgi:hypothetical protein
MKTNQYDRASRAATLRPAFRLSSLERDRDVVSQHLQMFGESRWWRRRT